MKASERRDSTNEELLIKKEEILSEMMNLRFQAAKGVQENPARVRFLRRDVARINTIFKEREMQPESVAGSDNGK